MVLLLYWLVKWFEGEIWSGCLELGYKAYKFECEITGAWVEYICKRNHRNLP